jgi:two-component system cell cycle response regulator
MRILIADDDAVSRRLLEATLVKLGHKVIAVPDGTQAMAALMAADAPPLAILDWMMPGLDGVSLCREIRKRPGPYIYIILLTALNSPSDLVTGLESGADDFLTKPFNAGELRARLYSGTRVLDLQTTLLDVQRALHWRATRDDLTGLWNRRMILDQLGIELNRTSREKKPLAVALADLDVFKQINDTHGHTVGDAVLREAAARLQVHLRSYDFIGRYGGEEFMVLIPGCDTPGGIEVARRLCTSIAAAPMHISGIDVPVTVSIGVSSTTDVGPDSAALLAAADAALYRAKAGGRNRVEGSGLSNDN